LYNVFKINKLYEVEVSAFRNSARRNEEEWGCIEGQYSVAFVEEELFEDLKKNKK
jgi:hypothetical protein